MDLVDLMRSAETVKEMYERDTRTQCRGLSDEGHIMGLLHACRGEHRKTGRAGRHYVLMIAEDRQGLGGK